MLPPFVPVAAALPARRANPLLLRKNRHGAFPGIPDPSGEGALGHKLVERAVVVWAGSGRDDVEGGRGGAGIRQDRCCQRPRGGQIVPQSLDEAAPVAGQRIDQLRVIDVLDRDPGFGHDHQRKFLDVRDTARSNAEGSDDQQMRSGHSVPEREFSFEARGHAPMQTVTQQEGLVGQVLDHELWPERAAANSLTSPMSSMSRRGPVVPDAILFTALRWRCINSALRSAEKTSGM